MLAKAIGLAALAHDGQKDKAGAPYIFHPLRVLASVSLSQVVVTVQLDQAEALEILRTVAVLHDVVEDTSVRIRDLREQGFTKPVLDALDLLTRRAGQEYFSYIRRIRDGVSPFALAVKLADIADNTTPSRMNALDAETRRDLKMRYAKAKRMLTDARSRNLRR